MAKASTSAGGTTTKPRRRPGCSVLLKVPTYSTRSDPGRLHGQARAGRHCRIETRRRTSSSTTQASCSRAHCSRAWRRGKSMRTPVGNWCVGVTTAMRAAGPLRSALRNAQPAGIQRHGPGQRAVAQQAGADAGVARVFHQHLVAHIQQQARNQVNALLRARAHHHPAPHRTECRADAHNHCPRPGAGRVPAGSR